MKRIFLFSPVFLMLVLISCSLSDNAAGTKPNIVFIFLDDLGWTDLGYMGSEYYESPVIDKLARGGMIFTNAYSNAANCAPTRASLLSGQYSPRTGVFTVGVSTRGKSEHRRLIPTKNSKKISLDKITIAEALKDAGYVSAAIGKWNVGNKPTQQGFDYAIDRWDMGINDHFNDKGEYLSDIFTEEAISFIKENNPKDTGKPFFVYLAHHAVHTPIQAREEYIDEFKKKEGSGCHNNPTYAAMIKSVDEGIGKISSTLEELDLSENTILVFFSDNGGHGTYTCQKPLRGGKGMFYEGGIRVPMFAYWPEKIRPNTICDQPVMGTDFYPTFLELAGLEAPDNYTLDGKSLVTMLKGEKAEERELFWHFPSYLQSYEGLKEDSRDTIFRSRPVSVIRKGDWKLMMFHEEWSLDGGRERISDNNAVELYNLKEDISEQINLANSNIKKRDELLNELLQWQEDINAQVPNEANPEYVSKSSR